MISRRERIVVVILSIALAVFAVVFYFWARETYVLKKNYNTAMETYQEINRSYPFTPEEDQKLSGEQIDSFFQIQQRLSADPALRATFAPGARIYGGKEKCHLWVSVVPTHQQALLDIQMSFNEYQWITRRIFTTLLVAADQGHQVAHNVVAGFHSYIRKLRYYPTYVQEMVESAEERLRERTSAITASEIELTLQLLRKHPVPPEVMHFYFSVLRQDLHLMR